MGQMIELREIPRNELGTALEAAARQLKADPGAGYQGDCDMFARSDHFPACRGKCKRGGACHLVIIGIEGSHSDLYNYLIFCTCMSNEELDKLIRGRAQLVPLPDPAGRALGGDIAPVGD